LAIYPNDGETLEALLSKANRDMEQGHTLTRALDEKEDFNWGVPWTDYGGLTLSDTRH
jgi:hypothetical protein